MVPMTQVLTLATDIITDPNCNCSRITDPDMVLSSSPDQVVTRAQVLAIQAAEIGMTPTHGSVALGN